MRRVSCSYERRFNGQFLKNIGRWQRSTQQGHSRSRRRHTAKRAGERSASHLQIAEHGNNQMAADNKAQGNVEPFLTQDLEPFVKCPIYRVAVWLWPFWALSKTRNVPFLSLLSGRTGVFGRYGAQFRNVGSIRWPFFLGLGSLWRRSKNMNN